MVDLSAQEPTPRRRAGKSTFHHLYIEEDELYWTNIWKHPSTSGMLSSTNLTRRGSDSQDGSVAPGMNPCINKNELLPKRRDNLELLPEMDITNNKTLRTGGHKRHMKNLLEVHDHFRRGHQGYDRKMNPILLMSYEYFINMDIDLKRARTGARSYVWYTTARVCATYPWGTTWCIP